MCLVFSLNYQMELSFSDESRDVHYDWQSIEVFSYVSVKSFKMFRWTYLITVVYIVIFISSLLHER